MISCEQIFRTRLSQESIFVVAKNNLNDGILAITKSGSLIGGMVDEANLLPSLLNCKHIPNIKQLAFAIAGRYKLPGVDNMFIEQFNTLLIGGDYAGAALIASQSPGSLIRNQETIQKFKSLPQMPNQPQPLLIYFQKLLEKGKLTKLETLELCVPVLTQGKIDFVSNWVNNNKLEMCQELGDMVARFDKNLALKIYTEGKHNQKAVQMMMEMGMQEQAMKYAEETNTPVDMSATLNTMIDVNPEGALKLAKSLWEKNKDMNVHQIADMFLRRNRIQEFTSLLFDCMRKNLPEDGIYQTKVLELNMMTAPQVVDTILNMKIWNQYNKPKIAALCEQKGLYQRALENYTDPKDIKRVLMNTHALPPEYVTEYLSNMPAETSLACMAEMLKFNRQNLQTVITVCVQGIQKFGVSNIIKMFESVGSFEGIYYFLGSILNNTTDPEIHYKYIEACAKIGQFRVVEEVIKNKRDCYDPIKVKDLLIEMKLSDPRPIIFLCDAHNQIEELTRYLYKNNMSKYIEVYLFKVCQNPQASAIVLGTLIDLECDEPYIKQILKTLRSQCPMEQIVDEFDKRNKLRVLESWLDDRVAEGVQIPAVHNALAKIKIDTNQNPQDFLANNQFYDPKVIGKFCEDRDPHLAVIAYKRSYGMCDQELIMCTNKNALYRLQAQYLVNRQSKELWKMVLSPDNPYRKQIVDQVVSSALPESKNPDEVITAVQAFMEAELTFELMSLLEKIVLHNSDFAQYKKLQNLLIITAIKSDKGRVMDYINRLDNYDGPQIAKIAIGEPYQLYEEALAIYRKKNLNLDAIEVLLDYIQNIQRATDFAEKVNQPEVWSRLGNAYLDKFMVNEAIDCYMKAKDTSQFLRVINITENEPDNEAKEGKYENLVKYLLMIREVQKDPNIDNALTFALAKLNKISELESFLSNSNSTDCQKVGDRCFKLKLYEAAKVLYTIVKNNSKIASCLVHLKQFNVAIEAAKKANTPKTWKELCMACVAAQEYKLANMAGMHIIIHPDELEDLIRHYESLGVTNEMINLLETGVGLERAHVGIFTELAVLYAKYKPERLMDHCKTYMQKLNITKVLRACERFMLWSEAVYLYSHYNEFDNAINIMIEHSPYAFQNDLYLQLIQKVSNTDLYYKSMVFYLEEQPLQLNDLLKSLTAKIDLVKCVSIMRKLGFVSLITPFLKSVQATNTREVNEALNEIYLENEDFESLRQSITQYDGFDAAALAKITEAHEFLEFRRIAAYLYRRIGKYDLSMNLSKNDEMYRDAIETAQESGKTELIE
jgi:clathrin heavy chain